MNKLPTCRMCLVEGVRMFIVVDKNLHELYKKLTDIPFVTEDRRPMLACFFCLARLKQCYRFLTNCLKAEELFAQILNEDYEPNPLINQDHLKFYSGFIKSPTENISIDNVVQTESIAVKQELPADCEVLDIIEPKEEYQSDELELENLDSSYLDVADIPPHHSESDSEDDVPLMVFKTEVGEVSKKKRRARETIWVTVAKKQKLRRTKEKDPITAELMRKDKSDSSVIRTTQQWVTVLKKQKLRRTKEKDPITAELMRKDKSDSSVIRTTQKCTSNRDTYFKERYKCYQHSFSENNNLKSHIRIYTGENSYKCDVCQRNFSQKGYLTKHIRIHTGDKPNKCDICQRRFTQKGGLIRHIRIHTGEKPYKCGVCQRSFSRKGLLINHTRIHTREKPYNCDVCQRSFTEKGGLIRHIRIHTGENPHKCDVCRRSFSRKGLLINHTRIHTREKPYKCDVCQRSFTEKGGLIRHTRIHSGEKPHKCEICERSFRQSCNLKRHIRQHTVEKPVKCEICLISFSDLRALKVHLRVHT